MNESQIQKSLDEGRFCSIRLDNASKDANYVNREYALIDNLYDLIMNKYGDEIAGVRTDMWAAAILYLEIIKAILDKELIGFLQLFLSENSQDHCILIDVYDHPNLFGDAGKYYLGKIVVTVKEIVVEDTLVDTWDNQVGFE